MTGNAKRTLLIIMAVISLFGVINAAQPAAAVETATVMGDDVYMRALSTTQSNVLATLSHNTEVVLLGKKDDWYNVEYNGMKGFIHSDFLFTHEVKGKRAYTVQDGVNIRLAASESSYVCTTVTAGKTLRINDISGDWYSVTYEGYTGFVKRDLVTISKNLRAGDEILKQGMSGSRVRWLQNELIRRGFLRSDLNTGDYGSKTRDAVKDFQKTAKMDVADGIAGPETIALLEDRSNNIRKVLGGNVTANDVKGRVQLIDWWKGGSSLLARPGGVATVTDVRTGKSFKIRRSGGNKHFDVHPLTAEDTAIFKSIVGSWTWNRRSIWLSIGSRVYAASMNCMPHSPDPSKTDNFPGHFCIHLLNSRTHGSNSLDSAHQACIKYAYERGN